jgi:hypothetical protein
MYPTSEARWKAAGPVASALQQSGVDERPDYGLRVVTLHLAADVRQQPQRRVVVRVRQQVQRCEAGAFPGDGSLRAGFSGIGRSCLSVSRPRPLTRAGHFGGISRR